MKKLLFALVMIAGTAMAQLTPDTFTLTWTRQGTTALINTNIYLSETTYWLTNCQALRGTATQDLTGCGIVLRVGDSTTNRVFYGWIENTTTGLFGCAFTIPTKTAASGRSSTMTTSLQLTITNAATTVIDREQKQLYYSMPLQ